MKAFVSGCFDLLHPGHIHLLEIAKEIIGEEGQLHVGINSDESVEALKGRKPVMDQWERCSMVMALSCVWKAHFFSDRTPVELMSEIRPKLVFRGDDGTPITKLPGYEELTAWGGLFIQVPKLRKLSTTTIIERIRSRK